MAIGEFIRSTRLEKRLSIRELSRLSGVSHPYLSQIETGKNDKPSPDLLKKISEHLDVSYPDLMIEAGYISEMEWIHAFIDADFHVEDEEVFKQLLGSRNASRELNNLLDGGRSFFYNGHLLSKDDCSRIRDMLNAMFPEYKELK